MDRETLQLTLCQLLKVSEVSKKNHSVYSDNKKLNFHREIDELLSEIQRADFGLFDDDDQLLHKELFEILFTWLEFLDNSTLNNIPYEIVACLQAVLKDWLDSHNLKKFVIVTTLQSHISFGYFDWDLSDLTPYVKGKYKKDIVNPLVPINLPKYLVHDYLANVTLYHELGHFIDQHFKISKRVVDSYPLYAAMKGKEKLKMYYHISEFFADLFAAQYIGDTCSNYLNYIAFKQDDSDTHPSTARRVDVVNSFLTGKDDVIIKILSDATEKLTGKKLQPKRYVEIKTNEFEDYLPAEIDQSQQLHYLYIQGWDSWRKRPGMLGKHKPPELYKVINNLIEKSISNFIISTKWKSKCT